MNQERSPGGKSSFYDYFNKLIENVKQEQIRERFETGPGEQAQFEWSEYAIKTGDSREAENILFLEPPGVGKTHLSIGIGIKACEKRIITYFITAQQLLEQLKLAQISGTFTELLDKFARYELFIIDELGYLPMTAEDAKIFFKLISMKYERTSVIITTNQPFKNWGEIFKDDVIATAILDRLMHHAVIFKINGKSYRLKDR